MAFGGRDNATLRILLMGRTGQGKSSLGNVLLGKRSPKDDEVSGSQTGFKVAGGLSSETKQCNWGTAVRFGVTLEVTDTPGLCDTHMEEVNVYKELLKSVLITKPGPHVFIFVLRADRRFTKEEREAYQTLKRLFSGEMDKYLIIVFNAIDQPAPGETIAKQREALTKNTSEFMDPPSPENSGNAKALSQMIKDAEGRYMGMNNRASPEDQEAQIKDLIDMMQDLVAKNRGAVFRTDLTELIIKITDELTELNKITEEQMEESAEHVPRPLVLIPIIEKEADSGFLKPVVELVHTAVKKLQHGIRRLCRVM